MLHSKPQHNWESTKRNSRQNYSKKLDRNKLVLTQNVLKIDETESKGAKPVYHWERLLKAYLIFLDTIIFSRDRLVSGSAFLHFNAGNGAMPLNPRPKRPPYVVFFVLYEFCVVLTCCMHIVFFVLYFFVVWNCPCLCVFFCVIYSPRLERALVLWNFVIYFSARGTRSGIVQFHVIFPIYWKFWWRELNFSLFMCVVFFVLY